jgi:hypothetical protein
MFTEVKYSYDFRGDIFLSDERRCACHEERSDEIRHEETLILLLYTSKRAGSESFLSHPSIELVLAHWHEGDLCPCEKCESGNQKEKHE